MENLCLYILAPHGGCGVVRWLMSLLHTRRRPRINPSCPLVAVWNVDLSRCHKKGLDGKLDLAMQWAYEQETAGGEVNFKEGLAFYSSIGILQVRATCHFQDAGERLLQRCLSYADYESPIHRGFLAASLFPSPATKVI